MHRFIMSKNCLRLIQPSACNSRTAKYGSKDIFDKLEALRTLSTLNDLGLAYCGCKREPITGSMQLDIVDALRLGERSKAASLLSDLYHKNHSSSADDFIHILRYCARSPDPLFVMETWRIMKEKQVDIDAKCFYFIIRALCKGGYIKEAFNLMCILGENPDVYPILPMYNNILGGCAQTHTIDYVDKCLDVMEQQMMGKNEVTYTELLKLAVLQENLSAVHEIWKECVKYYSLSILSLRKFIWSFTRLRDLESAHASLQHMIALAFQEGFPITTTAEGKFCTSRLDIPMPLMNGMYLMEGIDSNGNLFPSVDENCKKTDAYPSKSEYFSTFNMGRKEFENVGTNIMKKELGLSVTKVLRWSFNDVIHACAQMQNYRLAEQLMIQMQNLGLEPSSSTYDGFIRAIVSEKGFCDGMEVLKIMQQKNIKVYDSTLATLSISCSRDLELDLAEEFLDQISTSHSAYLYNALLTACDSLDQPERAVKILAKMKKLKVQPDIRTYELLFSLFGSVNAPYEEGNMLSQVVSAKRINAIELDMAKSGIQHSYLSLNNLLKALGMEGMIKELIQHLNMAENRFSYAGAFLGTSIYNTVLHSLVEAKESHVAIEIFRSMKSCGVVPDAATYNIMIDCCSVIRCFTSACALLSMMIRDGFYPQTTTYTALIKILLRCEGFDEALNLLEKGISEGIQPDVLLFNTVLQEACEKGRIDVIEFVTDQMRQKNIQPDPSTCSYVFSTYVEHGFFSTAMEALHVLSMRMISEEGTIEEIRPEIEENFILAEESEAEKRILDLFKDGKVNFAAALLNLRWCAMLGFPISWFPEESQWTKRLSSSCAYRSSG